MADKITNEQTEAQAQAEAEKANDQQPPKQEEKEQTEAEKANDQQQEETDITLEAKDAHAQAEFVVVELPEKKTPALLPLTEKALFQVDSLPAAERQSLAGVLACLLSEINHFFSLINSYQPIVARPVNEDAVTPTDIQQLVDAKAVERTEAVLKWNREFFAGFVQFAQLDSSVVSALEPIAISNEPMSPQPFLEALGANWVSDEVRVRMLLIFLHFSVVHQNGLDSRVQAMLRQLCSVFEFDYSWFLRQEALYPTAIGSIIADEANKAKQGKKKSWWKIGLLGLAGGVIIGLTGGLAAPAIGVGVGALGLGGAALTSTVVIGTLFGVTGTGLVGYKASKRYSICRQFAFLPVKPLMFAKRTEQPPESDKPEAQTQQTPTQTQAAISPTTAPAPTAANEAKDSVALQVVITVNGFLKDNVDVTRNWLFLLNSKQFFEPFTIEWETKELLAFGNALMNFVGGQVKGKAISEVVKRTLLSGIFAAVALPMTVLSVAGLIDNPWSIVMNRSEEAGLILADALLAQSQGRRPVCLMGFSVGAKMIFASLLELADRRDKGEAKAGGLVLDVLLCGLPVPINSIEWKKIRSVVSGRIINCFSSSDWVLSVLSHTSGFSIKAAGLHPVSVPGVENFDASEIVSGHLDYVHKMEQISTQTQFIRQ